MSEDFGMFQKDLQYYKGYEIKEHEKGGPCSMHVGYKKCV